MATKHDRTPAGVGVGDGARTRDNQIHSLGLYQLSYAHHVSSIAVPSRGTHPARRVPPGGLARLKGLEPLTCCLEGSRSIHLSYRRVASPAYRQARRAGGRPLECGGNRPRNAVP